MLRHEARSVGEMAKELPVSRPAVSQHLKVLKEAGLVTETPKGTRRIYRIDSRGLEELRRYLDGFWEDVLEAFEKRVELDEGGQYGAPES
jgi:DNA-binding transcriptional ArsR family regulator